MRPPFFYLFNHTHSQVDTWVFGQADIVAHAETRLMNPITALNHHQQPKPKLVAPSPVQKQQYRLEVRRIVRPLVVVVIIEKIIFFPRLNPCSACPNTHAST